MKSFKSTTGSGFVVCLPYIVPTLIFMVWFFASETGVIPRYVMPHPVDVGRSGYEYIFGHAGPGRFSGRFLGDLGASLIRVLLGFGTAACIGIPLGVVSGRVMHVNRLLSTTVNAVRAVPGISWLPLAMVWFGVGMSAITMISGTGSNSFIFWPNKWRSDSSTA